MPIYEYQCPRKSCLNRFDERRTVPEREWTFCPRCKMLSERVFTPTANVFVHEHFRHLQSALLPDRSDTAAWEARSSNSQYRPTSEPKRESLAEHMEREMVQMGEKFWQPQGEQR